MYLGPESSFHEWSQATEAGLFWFSPTPYPKKTPVNGQDTLQKREAAAKEKLKKPKSLMQDWSYYAAKFPT